MRNLIKLFSILVLFFFTVTQSQSAEKVDYLKTDWSFKGLFGKFDRVHYKEGTKFTQRFVHRVIQ